MKDKYGKMPSKNTIKIINNHKKYEKIEGVESSSLPSMFESLKDKVLLTIDIETKPKKGFKYYDLAGLDPHTSDIVSIQIGDDEETWVID